MITAENYYSQRSNIDYMSVSQFKSFMKCESMALAQLAEDYILETSTALLVGSYVDSYFEGTLDIFKAQNSDLFTQKGELKAPYKQAEYIIRRIERDGMFMKYMAGEKQVIMTGEIEGVPFKIKMDSYHTGKVIVDLKIVRDFEPIWTNGQRISFVEAWGYDIQGAVYQEIVRQNTGDTLPFVIAAATKEAETDIELLSIPQDRLDHCLEYVRKNVARFAELKKTGENPERCGCCNWCKQTKVLTEIIDYRDLGVKS